MNLHALSAPLQQQLKPYTWQRCTAGMSPAKVYRLTGPTHTLYLKTSSHTYAGTTYDVRREKDMLEWLQGKLPVPEVVHFEQGETDNVLVMHAAVGELCADVFARHQDPYAIIDRYVEALNLLQAVDIADCPYDNRVAHRLHELDDLLQRGLADTNPDNWQTDTAFASPELLYQHLVAQVPPEDLVLSHGDLTDSNVLISGQRVTGFIDVGRTGKADRWYDIAFCVRSIQEDFGPDPAYLDYFFKALEVDPDWDKIRYFMLLDELF